MWRDSALTIPGWEQPKQGLGPFTLLGFSLADPWGNISGGSSACQAAEWGVKFPLQTGTPEPGWGAPQTGCFIGIAGSPGPFLFSHRMSGRAAGQRCGQHYGLGSGPAL